MNNNGKQLIDSLCNRLTFKNELLTDSNILRLLSSLDKYELNQLIIFGNIDKWIREMNKAEVKKEKG